jgi:transcriptional regulator with XRE-family HTH domain
VIRYSPNRQTLGSVLRALRERAGLSQEGLGFRARLHRNYVGSAERGERNISFDAIERWLAALGLTWTELGMAMDKAAKRDAMGQREQKVAEPRRGY